MDPHVFERRGMRCMENERNPLISLFSVSHSITLFLLTPVSVNLWTKMLRRLQIKYVWSCHELVLTTTYWLITTRYCRKCDIRIVNRTNVFIIRWRNCKDFDPLTNSRHTRESREMFKRSFGSVSRVRSIDHWWENSSSITSSADLL